MTEYIVKFLAVLASIAEGLHKIAAAIEKNGPPIAGQVLTVETATPTASVSPTLDALKEKASKANAAKTPAPEAPKEPAATPPTPETPTASTAASGDKPVEVAHLRTVGTALVADGKKTEFLAIIGEFGAKNVTTVPEDKRAACLDKLEKALGKKLCQLED